MRTVAKRFVRIAVSLLSLWLVATGLRGDGARWLIASAASNPIAVENSQTGNPASEWDIGGAGDPSIQDYDRYQRQHGPDGDLQGKTNSTNYKIDIYRLGYYEQRRAQGRNDADVGVCAGASGLSTTPPQGRGCATSDPPGSPLRTWNCRLLAVDQRRVESTWPSSPETTPAGRATSSHRARRRASGRRGDADLRHDVAAITNTATEACGGPVSNAGRSCDRVRPVRRE